MRRALTSRVTRFLREILEVGKTSMPKCSLEIWETAHCISHRTRFPIEENRPKSRDLQEVLGLLMYRQVANGIQGHYMSAGRAQQFSM